jgi:UMP-CMP kinase
MTSMQFFFLELIEGLKNTLRRGWVLRGVPDPESVSDHMYRMAIMCYMAPGVCYLCSLFVQS